jgi:glucose/arabinose dehydrogenase
MFASLTLAAQDGADSRPAPANIGLELVAGGFTRPVYVTSAPNDAGRLFVVEQSGRITIIDNGFRVKQPLLTIADLIDDGGEKGLLSMAFDPRFERNRRFYVFYYAKDDHTVVARYRFSKVNPDAIQAGNVKILLKVLQPFENHNGGQLQFGPDGYLYIGLGDGGSGGDPRNYAQDLGTHLGKILRLNVRRLPAKNPPTNPFVKRSDAVHAIWAYGLRNPWRFSFDRLTGDLWIGDVGQNEIEEIDFQPASSTGGENYGWRVMEGSDCYGTSGGCDTAGKVLPVHEYTRADGTSVTGGYVYRGSAIPALNGHYFFADFTAGRIWSFKRLANGAKSEFTEWTGQLEPPDGSALLPSSFGEDADGELYLCDFAGGRVFRIVAR